MPKDVEDVEPMEVKTRIRIGGMKFSEELVHVTVCAGPGEGTSFDDLLHLLAGRQINIPFICHFFKDTSTESSFCILRNDLARVREVFLSTSFTGDDIRIVTSVGTLTLFPHRNSFELLGLVLGTFSRGGYPIHSLSTSISAIAVNTEFSLLEDIAAKLSDVVTLPDNHAPFRQEFRLTQLY